jgi:hypothetical protein
MTLRWLARVLSICTLAILLMFAIGEGLNLSRFTARESLLFAFFPFGLCVGMVVAWRREILGGGITVASLAAFYLADRLLSSSFPRGIAFVALAVPGFLFLLCGLLARSTKKHGGGKF